MSQQRVKLVIKDGQVIRIEPEAYKEYPREPKKHVVMNRPGHVRPLHKKRQ